MFKSMWSSYVYFFCFIFGVGGGGGLFSVISFLAVINQSLITLRLNERPVYYIIVMLPLPYTE